MSKKLLAIILIFIVLIIIIILAVFITTGSGCKRIDHKTASAIKPITLNYWRVWDGPDYFAEIITAYKSLHPFVNINYRKLRYDEYEQELIEAFAVDKGPDIFSLHNTWTHKYQSKGLLTPMPASITMAYPAVRGTIKKEVFWEMRANNCLTLNQIKNNFADVVYGDVVINALDAKTNKVSPEIFALPLFIDTLAMYYNKDLFNNAGITSPPEYWNKEFQQNVKKLTKQNNKGQIVQAGVALGGSDNIERANDILAVLMMQNGTVMMEGGQIKFHQKPANYADRSYSPGLDALRFYTDFANPAKEVYGWNSQMDNSLDLFSQGKLAIMFGYAYMLPDIKARAPKLNFNIVPLPQIEGNPQSVNFANYWVEAVSHKSQYANAAWDFIQYATKAQQAKLYLDKAKKPTALRVLIDEQINDPEIGEFAKQVLTAKSWYQGNDAVSADTIMLEMIDQVNVDQTKMAEIINQTVKKVQQTVTAK